MPPLSRFAVRSSLVCLVAGFALGALLLGTPLLARPAPGALLLLHAELLLFGWLLQLAFGVAYWILPRLPGRPDERGRPLPALLAILLLQSALLAAILLALGGPAGLGTLGRGAVGLSALSFGTHAWPRVRAAMLLPRT